MFQRISLATALVALVAITGCAAGTAGEDLSSTASANSKGRTDDGKTDGRDKGRGDVAEDGSKGKDGEDYPGKEQDRPDCACDADEDGPNGTKRPVPSVPAPPPPPEGDFEHCIIVCKEKIANRCGESPSYCLAVCKGEPVREPAPNCDADEWKKCEAADEEAPPSKK